MQIECLYGPDAVAAWKAYVGNRALFGGTREQGYACTLQDPATIFLVLPGQQMPGLHGITDRAAAARHMGRQACAALLLTAPGTDNVYTMLYVHTRSNQQGAGCGSKLLQQAKLLVGNGTLRTHAAACRTYYATLLTLRNGFMADIALFNTDIPLPGQAIPTGSSELDLWWSPRMQSVLLFDFTSERPSVVVHASRSTTPSSRCL